MVAGDREDRPGEPAEEVRGTVVLVGAAAVGEVPAGDDQLGVDAGDERLETGLQPGIVVAPEMQVREVQNSYPSAGHGRGRLYTQIRGR